MALTDENTGFNVSMPVAPAAYGYGMPYMGSNNGGLFGNGGDSWLGILFLIALCNGGWGGFGGGFGGNQLGYDFPWLLNGQQNINANTNSGFRDAMLNDGITSIRDGISGLSTQLCGCCGDMQMSLANGFAGVQQSLCNGFAGTTAAVTEAQNAISQQMYSNELASLNRSFAEQTANTAGFTGVNSGIADLRYTVATEACADRAAISDALRDVIAANTASTQRILDQLCADKIESKNDTIAQLRSELMYARGQASQDVQTAAIRASQATTANQLVAELRSCPIPAQPVYGNQPIFSCPQTITPGCGCGCGA